MANKSLTIPTFPEFINILGTPWKIVVLKNDEEPMFERERCDGLTLWNEHTIKILDTRSKESYKEMSQNFHDDYIKEVLRHEIVHAFFDESGLGASANRSPGAWPMNEEMIDWFANQGQKIYKVWQDCGCLRVMPVEMWMDLQKNSKDGAKK